MLLGIDKNDCTVTHVTTIADDRWSALLSNSPQFQGASISGHFETGRDGRREHALSHAILPEPILWAIFHVCLSLDLLCILLYILLDILFHILV